MGRQDARQKKGETRHKTKKNWETRHETKKMGRQDARKKNGEMRRKTNKKLGDKMRDQNKWGYETRDQKK